MNKHYDEHLLDTLLHDVREKLRPAQIAAVEKTLSNRRVVYDIRMGKGKTVTALTSVLADKPNRVLILCTKNALNTWQNEIRKWFPLLLGSGEYEVVQGTKKRRLQIWRRDALFHVTTFAAFKNDFDELGEFIRGCDAIICDEFHRAGLRNKDTKMSKTVLQASKIVKPNTIMTFLSGSWQGRGAQDMFALLQIIDRDKFPSYWKYVSRYLEVEDGPFGKSIVDVRSPKALALRIEPHVIKDHSSDDLPDIVRVRVDVSLTPAEFKLYRTMRDELVAVLEDDILFSSNTLGMLSQLRQFLVCPKTLSDSLGMGSTFDAILDKLEDMPERLQHCVIFVPFRQAVYEYKAALHDAGYSDVSYLMGGITPEFHQDQVDTFKNGVQPIFGKPSIMVCSLKYAESFELSTAHTCFFAGFDYNPQDNYQAEGRLRRMSSDQSVGSINSFYMVQEDTISVRAFEILDSKMYQIGRSYEKVPDILDSIDAQTFLGV